MNASEDVVGASYLALVSGEEAGSVIDQIPSTVTAKSITARKM